MGYVKGCLAAVMLLALLEGYSMLRGRRDDRRQDSLPDVDLTVLMEALGNKSLGTISDSAPEPTPEPAPEPTPSPPENTPSPPEQTSAPTPRSNQPPPPEKSVRYVTNKMRYDGFGSQVVCIFYAYAYARSEGKQFCLVPSHYPGNMGHGFHRWHMKYIGLFPSRNNSLTCPSPPPKEEYPDCQRAEVNENPDKYFTKEVLKELRAIYDTSPKLDLGFEKGAVNVAIHIRMGHHLNKDLMKRRYIPLEDYRDLINELRKEHKAKGKKVVFHVYSEKYILAGGSFETVKKKAKPVNFGVLKARDVRLRLDEPIESTFQGFVESDILVIGASEYSVAAGYLHKGTVYYPRMNNNRRKLFRVGLAHYKPWGPE